MNLHGKNEEPSLGQPDTKALLLDAAEELFARDGYRGTSVRAITRQAGVNLAGVNYHFGSKKGLLEELFLRSFGTLNSRRRELIEGIINDASSAGRRPEVRDILRAFISPVFECTGDRARLRRISSLVYMAHASTDPDVLESLVKTFMPLIEVLFMALHAALPETPDNELVWKTHFFIGGFAHTIHISLFESKEIKGAPLPEPMDLDRLTDLMVDYFTRALEA